MDDKILPKGIPWTGRKRPGPYRYYSLFVAPSGLRVASDGRAYQVDHYSGSLRAVNKPTSQRDRHRAAVANR